MPRIVRSSLFSLILVGLLGHPVRAQQTLGSINGTVADGTGAVVQNADVKVQNVATGLEQPL
jgi:hypothetical protein